MPRTSFIAATPGFWRDYADASAALRAEMLHPLGGCVSAGPVAPLAGEMPPDLLLCDPADCAAEGTLPRPGHRARHVLDITVRSEGVETPEAPGSMAPDHDAPRTEAAAHGGGAHMRWCLSSRLAYALLSPARAFLLALEWRLGAMVRGLPFPDMEIALHEALINGIIHGNFGLDSPDLHQGEQALAAYDRIIRERLADAAFATKPLWLDAWYGTDGVILQVVDAGAGIPDAHLARLRGKPVVHCHDGADSAPFAQMDAGSDLSGGVSREALVNHGLATSGRGLWLIHTLAHKVTPVAAGRGLRLHFGGERP
ncbi:hypothetical protein [Yunchengibacter salinarum]|uniref:hypothetical protein n=1 Tax=Yunchengibacter salinarum TaxID=3133399 RepID=UPI0035B6329E